MERFEKIVIKYQRYSGWIFLGSLFLGYVTLHLKQPMLTLIIWGISMSVLVIEGIIGWRKSVRKLLKVCIFYNLFFSLLLTAIVQEKIEYPISSGLFTTIYMIIWFFLSLISYSKISILVNEVISGISATVFTIGTYLVSLRLGSLPSIEEFHDYFKITSKFEMESASISRTILKYAELKILDALQSFFVVFLPIIGTSTLCIIFIKIKMYWLEKNQREEPEDILGAGNRRTDRISVPGL